MITRSPKVIAFCSFIKLTSLLRELEELEELGMVERIGYPLAPPKMEYKITSIAMMAVPVLEMIMKYGVEMMGGAGAYPPVAS